MAQVHANTVVPTGQPVRRRGLLWRPRSGMPVRVALGPGAGAQGIVQGKRTRYGMKVMLVEIDPSSPKMRGQWVDIAWWRLAPPRRRSRAAQAS